MEKPVEGEAASESREGCEKTVIRPPSPSTTHFSLLLEGSPAGRGRGRGRETGEGEGGHTHHAAWHTLHNIIYGAANKMDGYLERLAKLDRCPVTVLHGTDDEVLPLDCSYAFKSKVPTAQLKVIENKDHLTIVIGRQKTFARELGRRGKGKGDGERGKGKGEGDGERGGRREGEGGKEKGKPEGDGRRRAAAGPASPARARPGCTVGPPVGPGPGFSQPKPGPYRAGPARPDAHPYMELTLV
ncbi:hypothetical protein EJ110_NYTH06275 [Nymphaea thermarum]|nr:hypothetical protein EJ110_NYTH06275 [Nymphaea thermarum]